MKRSQDRAALCGCNCSRPVHCTICAWPNPRFALFQGSTATNSVHHDPPSHSMMPRNSHVSPFLGLLSCTYPDHSIVSLRHYTTLLFLLSRTCFPCCTRCNNISPFFCLFWHFEFSTPRFQNRFTTTSADVMDHPPNARCAHYARLLSKNFRTP